MFFAFGCVFNGHFFPLEGNVMFELPLVRASFPYFPKSLLGNAFGDSKENKRESKEKSSLRSHVVIHRAVAAGLEEIKLMILTLCRAS